MNLTVAAVAMWLVALWWGPADARQLALLTETSAPGIGDWWARWRERQRRRRRGQPETTQLLQAIVAELRAGMLPVDAFTHVLGADYVDPAALLRAPPTADASVWGDTARVWAVATDAGFSMATALQRVHAHASQEQAVFREVAALVAGPRYTSVLMSLLPVLILVGASAFGQSPLVWLFTTVPGWVVLLIGVAFEAGGLIWTQLAVKRVLR